MAACTAVGEEGLIDRLRAGDDACFSRVVAALGGTLRWLARGYLKDESLVDEAVQDTWLAVICGLDGFARRSTLRTWVCSILVNRARTIAARDARMTRAPLEEAEAVDARFTEDAWAVPPRSWSTESPSHIVANKEVLGLVARALDRLPQRQSIVVALHDLHGWTSSEICAALGINQTNQRVLLHRGRTRLRGALEELLARPIASIADPRLIEVSPRRTAHRVRDSA